MEVRAAQQHPSRQSTPDEPQASRYIFISPHNTSRCTGRKGTQSPGQLQVPTFHAMKQHGDQNTHTPRQQLPQQTQADWGAAQICITANNPSKVHLNYTLSTVSLNNYIHPNPRSEITIMIKCLHPNKKTRQSVYKCFMLSTSQCEITCQN